MRTARNTIKENEARVIDMLCKSSQRNIVQVFRHGELDPDSHYYIDIELCDLNLDDHARGKVIPPLPDWNDLRIQDVLAQHIFGILEGVVDGLMFIHLHQQVHRDLHPTNGTCMVWSLLKM